jgi:hypothetical protein
MVAYVRAARTVNASAQVLGTSQVGPCFRIKSSEGTLGGLLLDALARMLENTRLIVTGGKRGPTTATWRPLAPATNRDHVRATSAAFRCSGAPGQL